MSPLVWVHSDRKLLTGFARAARKDSKLTVINAISKLIILSRVLSLFYSVFRLFVGFIKAAFMACVPTIISVSNRAKMPTATGTQNSKLTRYS